jgi:charged multivesicular body protein 5
MNRIFGAQKPKTPKPTLSDAITNVPLPSLSPTNSQTDARIAAIDDKIKKLDKELATYRDRMSKMRDGPGKNALKQRAMKVLQQRKMYEGQRDQLQSSSWSMEQAVMTTENLRNTMTTVDAMKSANKEMRRQYGKIDVNKIERYEIFLGGKLTGIDFRVFVGVGAA